MLEMYNNILCIKAEWLTGEGGLLTVANYKNHIQRGKIRSVRIGGNGRSALIEYESLPAELRNAIEQKYDVYKLSRHNFFREHLVPDRDAIQYFGNYKLPDGDYLSTKLAKQYHDNVMFMKGCNTVHQKVVIERVKREITKVGIWQQLSFIVNDLKPEYSHKLPSNYKRLQVKCDDFSKNGYAAIIHSGYGNYNSKKVNEEIEKLILSLYVLNNKPYVSAVASMYLDFLNSKIDVVDIQSGEMFNLDNFYNSKGVPIVISESTIWNYINNPKNRAIVDSQRNDYHYYNGLHRPHRHMHRPLFSLSEITLDDRDLPRKLSNGKRVKAYYAFDIASEALIGISYSMNKDSELFIDCLRDMFRFLDRNNCGMPMEMEVEQHLVSNFKNDLMKAGVVFPFVRFCESQNSQEKKAERLIGIKKYQFEKTFQDGIGRYTLSETNRPKQDKVWNSDGMFDKATKYTYDEIVADDMFINNAYNNALHPDQVNYKGMSRLDVFFANQNPNAAKFEPALFARYIGIPVNTSIVRNQYLKALNTKYFLPTPEVMSKLQANNYNVVAYYIPNKEVDVIDKVYVYQNDNYIAECGVVETYNKAHAERTDADDAAKLLQDKYVSRFDKMIKSGRQNKAIQVAVVPREPVPNKLNEQTKPLETYKLPVIEEVEIEEFNYNPSNNAFDY